MHRFISGVFSLLLLAILTACSTMPGAAKGPGVHTIQTGYASFYGPEWHGRQTASGERLNIHAMTAAHKSLPFGTRVRVTLLSTGKSVVVRINDRGPFVRGRIIDLTDDAARKIGLDGHRGIGKVRLEVLR